MMNSKMKKLALATGLALGGMSLIPSTQAMNLATDGLGQVLIFPYYTVNGGWTSLFNITNTSGNVVMAKVRFHESYNSRDVFDLNIVLSPLDVWNMWVADTGNGPAIFTEDHSCTAGVIPAGGQPFDDGVNTFGTAAYTGAAADGGPITFQRMNEGYVEVVMMATATLAPAGTPDTQALPRGAVHPNVPNGTPPGCAALRAAFTSTTTGYGALQAQFPNYAGNPLKGSYNLVNGNLGLTAAGSPTTIANFRTTAYISQMLTVADAGLIFGDPAVGYTISFHEPSLNSGTTAAQVLNTNDVVLAGPAVPVDIGVAQVTYLLMRQQIINQWSRITNPTNQWTTQSDWVVTFPSKAFYVDNQPANEYSARFADRVPAVPGGPDATDMPAPFGQFFDNSAAVAPAPTLRGRSCKASPVQVRDREEYLFPGATFSPGQTQQLCYEANTMTFNGSNILNSATTSSVVFNPTFGDSGWMLLNLGTGVAAGDDVAGNSNLLGLPVIGFSITRRDTGNGDLNEAFLVDHAYTRTTTPVGP
jgi:hypothetical protein